jgi:hypothetical protein
MSPDLGANIMVAEVFAGLSAFKAMFDLAKGLKDINDATIRNTVVIELQEQILTAQAAQSDLIERVRDLEKEVADLKAWEGEKEKYELKPLGHRGGTAYTLRPEKQGTEPPHWICAQCYDDGKRSILQPFGLSAQTQKCYRCQSIIIL